MQITRECLLSRFWQPV